MEPDCFLGVGDVLLTDNSTVQSENTLSLATAKLSSRPIKKEEGGLYRAPDSGISLVNTLVGYDSIMGFVVRKGEM